MPDKDEYYVHVAVETAYIAEQSIPAQDHHEGRYVFAYTITITNKGAVAARLLSRHWIITDANNKVQEVQGEGVIGEQPHLHPGEYFRYTSGAILETPVGCMEGRYFMLADDGVEFETPIPAFSLSTPGTLH